MPAEPISSMIRRVLTHATIAALGVLTIVGSGGGAIGFPDIDYGGSGGSIPHSPYVQVFPLRPTVQAGTIVLFETTVISATPPLSYQWRRNGVDITGATGPTYTLGGAQLGDDGTQFTVVVSAANGVTTGGVVLLVSPLPGVVFQDADFPVSNWTVTATAQPTQNGPTHAESQASDGGNPDPYRSITYQMTPGPSSLHLDHFAVAATYDPGTQGAIYTIDVAEQCSRRSFSSASTFTGLMQSPMFEQAGRTYRPPMWARVLHAPFERLDQHDEIEPEGGRVRLFGAGLRRQREVPRLLGDRGSPSIRVHDRAGPRRRFTRRLPRAGHRQLESDGLEAITVASTNTGCTRPRGDCRHITHTPTGIK